MEDVSDLDDLLAAHASQPRRLKHQPLNTGTDEFRLIKLLPKIEQDPRIRCEVLVSNIASLPPYVALSYLWGPPEPCQDIDVNGCLLSIRQNLHDFLAMMREKQITTDAQDLLIFIDQVCIDQGNVRERNHQVRQMAQIYEKATEVIIWFGRESEYSREGMRKVLADNHRDYDDKLEAALETWGSVYAAEPWFKALTTNEYWQRLWIVQEVLLSRKLVVAWGSEMVIWQIFSDFLFNNGLRCADRPAEGDFLRGLVLGRQMRKANGRYDLAWSQALYVSNGTRCEDRRDKVYGLLGLILDGNKLEPDYAKPVKEVYLDLLRHSLRTEVNWGWSAWSERGQNNVAKAWRTELGLPEDFDAYPSELEGRSALPEWIWHSEQYRQEYWEQLANFGTSRDGSARDTNDGIDEGGEDGEDQATR